MLRRAVEQTQRSGPAAIGVLLAEKMSQYANLLASQGSLSTAIAYLPENTNQVCDTSAQVRLTARCTETEAHLCEFGPCRLPFSSCVSVSVGLWGSRWQRRRHQQQRRRLLQLRFKPRELGLSFLPRLKLRPHTRSPRRSRP